MLSANTIIWFSNNLLRLNTFVCLAVNYLFKISIVTQMTLFGCL